MKRGISVFIALLSFLCEGYSAVPGISYAGSSTEADSIRIAEPVERRDTLAESRIMSSYRRGSRTGTGLERIGGKKFNSGFAFMSSPDLIKTLQQLPGVASGTELMSGLYVHGGTGSDNLYLLDGVPLYSVSHFAGLFSSFDTGIIESADFYKSGFPARYGGRLSSVVDVSVRDGDFDKYKGEFSIGLIDGRIRYEGPIVRGKTSFSLSLRRSWLDLVTIPAMAIMNKARNDGTHTDFRYAFWDMNGRLTHKFSERNRLVFNVYYGNDILKIKSGADSAGDTSIKTDWGNATASVTWKNRQTEDFGYDLQAYYTRYLGDVGFMQKSDMEVSEDNKSRLNDIGIKADFHKNFSPMHRFRFGAGYQYHIYNPYRIQNTTCFSEEGIESIDRLEESVRYDGHEASVYAEDEISITKWFSINAGLRYALFGLKGKTYHALEPRAALDFRLSPSVSAALSYTEMNQFNHQISTMYMDLPTNGWMPSTAYIAPMRSSQYAGEIRALLPHDFRLDAGVFYKTMDNIMEYNGKYSMFPPLTQWESSFSSGRGKAFGAEVEAGWHNAALDISVYYTLSWSLRKFDDFYSGWYFDRNDNRHKFTVNATWKLNGRTDFYAAWNYHTGNRFTYPTHLTDYEDLSMSQDFFLYDKPNNAILPAYHRLDVGFNFRKTTKKGYEQVWNLSIYNAYCRINAFYGQIGISEGRYDMARATGMVPIIPSFSYSLKF